MESSFAYLSWIEPFIETHVDNEIYRLVVWKAWPKENDALFSFSLLGKFAQWPVDYNFIPVTSGFMAQHSPHPLFSVYRMLMEIMLISSVLGIYTFS